MIVVYVGIALVAMTRAARSRATPRRSAATTSRRRCSASSSAFDQAVAARRAASTRSRVAAAATLIAAANSAMLGLSRLAYSLSRNRQIPSALGRLHPTRSTPFVLIVHRGAASPPRWSLPDDLDFLVGIYAFGALLAFTIAHLSIIALRFREPDRERPYRMPLVGARSAAATLPLPAVLGAVLSARGLGQRRDHARRRALRRLRLDGVRPRALRRLPPDARASRSSSA